MRRILLAIVTIGLAFTTAACESATSTPGTDGDDAARAGASAATADYDRGDSTGGPDGTGSGAATGGDGADATPAVGDANTDGTDTKPAPASDSGAPGPQAAATVNGEKIMLAEFQRQVFETQRYHVEQGLDPNTEDGQRQLLYLRKLVLDDMINQTLIEQAAAEAGLVATEEELAERLAGYIEEFGTEEALEASLTRRRHDVGRGRGHGARRDSRREDDGQDHGRRRPRRRRSCTRATSCATRRQTARWLCAGSRPARSSRQWHAICPRTRRAPSWAVIWTGSHRGCCRASSSRTRSSAYRRASGRASC